MTNKATDQIDWVYIGKVAEEMSTPQLHFAIQSILDVLPSADSLDISEGGCRGGYYRDESSVYRRELASRGAIWTA